MLSLRHQALVTLMESGQPFKHGDPLYEDMIWETEMMRMSLEKKHKQLQKRQKAISKTLNRSRDRHVNDDIDQIELMDTISVLLFDEFTYLNGVEPNEVPWKEYFHAVYDIVMSDAPGVVSNARNVYESTKLYKKIQRPIEPQTPRVRVIDEAFTEYMDVQKRLEAKINLRVIMNKDLAECTEIAKALADVCRQMKIVGAKLDVYQRIVEWSLH